MTYTQRPNIGQTLVVPLAKSALKARLSLSHNQTSFKSRERRTGGSRYSGVPQLISLQNGTCREPDLFELTARPLTSVGSRPSEFDKSHL